MRRRTLLLSASAAVAGGLAVKTGVASASERTVLSSTSASTLAPREVTPYHPSASHPPAAVRQVARRDYSFARDGRALPTQVWAPVGPGPYPLVLFSHGLRSQPDDYASLLARWAQAGFVVAAPRYPHTALGTSQYTAYDLVDQPEDASEVITRMLERDEESIDASRIAAAGHSGGAITTSGLFSAHRDDRLKAGILIAGTDFLGTPFTGPAAAMLLVHGRRDTSVKYDAARTVYAAIPWSRSLLTITDGGHQITGGELPAVAGTTAAFLRWSFYGGEPALAGPAALGGVATLEDELTAAAAPAR
ncbi:alpha/beta hydrolase family protein [Paractinoplanes maris]|uniref:alpha/beta hydrolase family protein n=1 Tax=Paractinoplanes maris TaxID=1734446 RepID=UPI0020204295|nr:chlorophyllase [Actinoplanes maris]